MLMQKGLFYLVVFLLFSTCNRPSAEIKKEILGEDSIQILPHQLSSGLSKSTTELHRIKSQVLGYDLQYWVHLPKGYQEDLRYPVLYVTDGYWYNR